MSTFTILTEQEIANFVIEYTDWVYEAGELQANFTFADFDEAMLMVSKVADKAREMDHHPTWTNSYNKLSFCFATHDAGNKITNLDIEMATFISSLAKN